ncbi:hypothetical protein ABID92_001362 [Frigoribacterium sp. PvP120]
MRPGGQPPVAVPRETMCWRSTPNGGVDAREENTVTDGRPPLPRHFVVTLAVASLLLGVVACTPGLHDLPGARDAPDRPAAELVHD